MNKLFKQIIQFFKIVGKELMNKSQTFLYTNNQATEQYKFIIFIKIKTIPNTHILLIFVKDCYIYFTYIIVFKYV